MAFLTGQSWYIVKSWGLNENKNFSAVSKTDLARVYFSLWCRFWWRALVPPRNQVKVWVLKSIAEYIGWVCCLFWPLHKEVFLYLLLFPFFSKPKIFKTNMHPLCRCTSILKDVLPLNCHSFILWSKSLDKIRRKKRKWSIWIKIYDPKPRRPLQGCK